MRKTLLIAFLILLPSYLAAACTSGTPTQGENGGAPYLVYMPQPATCFNGNMILFAHGYVPPGPCQNLAEPALLPDGTSLPGLLNSLGFGFAASSFSKDGLAITQGIQDTKALENVIQRLYIPVIDTFSPAPPRAA